MNDFPGVGHVAVTVTDLSVSRPWYQRLIGAEPVLDEATDGDFHHTVFLIDGTLLGLHEHPSTDPDDTFTEFRTGLDHIAFGCPDRHSLTTWERDSTISASATAASSTPTSARASVSETPTASPSSSSSRQPDGLDSIKCHRPLPAVAEDRATARQRPPSRSDNGAIP